MTNLRFEFKRITKLGRIDSKVTNNIVEERTMKNGPKIWRCNVEDVAKGVYNEIVWPDHRLQRRSSGSCFICIPRTSTRQNTPRCRARSASIRTRAERIPSDHRDSGTKPLTCKENIWGWRAYIRRCGFSNQFSHFAKKQWWARYLLVTNLSLAVTYHLSMWKTPCIFLGFPSHNKVIYN